MLAEQDLLRVEEIVDRKTSDIRQDVSILKQDMSEVKAWQTKIGTKIESMDHKFDTALELLVEMRNEMIEFRTISKLVVNDHSPRITRLELAVKKKLA